MIVPAEIPQIPGDLEQLLGHAAGLRVTGPALAQTGSDVHTTWQGLVPHYTAPEAGNLFAATLPVRDVAVAVGEEIAEIGRALADYADTVRPVQTRLRELRTEAAAFTTGLPADGSWESDPALVERDAALLGEVNALVAAWQEAQRVCASAISALYGGPAYRADDGDGVLGPGEFGFTTAQLDALSAAGQPLPWGTPVERDPGFLGDVLTAWHGFAVSGFWADVTGVGSLFGIGPDGGHDWAVAGQAWGAIGELTIIPYVDDVLRGEMNPLQAVGTVYGNWGSVLAGAIALDEWGENPMGALGQTIYNVGTLPLAILKAAKPAAAAGRVAGAGLRDVGRRVTDALDRIPTVDELVRQYADRLDIHPRLGLMPAIVGDGPGSYRFDIENPAPGRSDGPASVPDSASGVPSQALDAGAARALDARLTELAERHPDDLRAWEVDQDHGGRASPSSRDEALVALDLRDRGVFPPDIQRPPGPNMGDFYSPSSGTYYDLKGLHSDWPPLANELDRSKPFPQAYGPSNRIAYLRNVQRQIDRGRTPVIDTRNADQAAIDDLRVAVGERGWDDHIIWYP